MLHGLLVGNLATWYFTGAPALARTHHVLLYDLRGHGRSERPRAGYDLATMARDLEALADEFSPEPLLLVGHSYGALIALRFALDNPDRVRRLALVEAPLPPGSFGEITGFMSRRPDEMIEAMPPALRAYLQGGGRRARRLVSSLAALATETSLLADIAREPDLPDDVLARLRCPVLCVYGRDSACAPVGERLARVIDDCTLVTLDGGHFLPLEAAPEVAQTLVEFANG